MKIVKKGFLVALLCFGGSMMSVTLIPFSSDSNGKLSELGIAAGTLFWIGLLAGTVVYCLVYIKSKQKLKTKLEGRKLPSCICFFSNVPAVVADIILILSVVLTMYCIKTLTAGSAIEMLSLVLLLAGIYGHFLFNGNVFRYIWKNRKDRRKEYGKCEGKM